MGDYRKGFIDGNKETRREILEKIESLIKLYIHKGTEFDIIVLVLRELKKEIIGEDIQTNCPLGETKADFEEVKGE